MRRRLFFLMCLLFCIAGLTVSQIDSVAKASLKAAQSRTITGTVVGISGRLAGRSAPFRLIINRYTSPEEVQQLTPTMQSGQDGLLNTLSHMDAGRISIGNNVGVTANADRVLQALPVGEQLLIGKVLGKDDGVQRLAGGAPRRDQQQGSRGQQPQPPTEVEAQTAAGEDAVRQRRGVAHVPKVSALCDLFVSHGARPGFENVRRVKSLSRGWHPWRSGKARRTELYIDRVLPVTRRPSPQTLALLA